MIVEESVPLEWLGQATFTKRLLVRDYQTKNPIPDVDLKAYDPVSGELVGAGKTDAKGEATLDLKIEAYRPYTLRLRAAEYGEKKWTGATDPGDEVSVIDFFKPESETDLTIPLIAAGVLALGAGLYLALS